MPADLQFQTSTIIRSMLARSPGLAEVFNSRGMACVGCVFSRFHSLAEATSLHQIDLDQFMEELSNKWLVFSDPRSDNPDMKDAV